MKRSRMSSIVAWPVAAMPMKACTADQTMVAPIANSAKLWKTSTSSSPITFENLLRRWCAAPVFSIAMPLPLSLHLVLRVHPLGLACQLVQRADVGLGRGDHDIGIRADAVDDASALRQAHRHLPLRLSAGGHGVHREEQQLGAALRDRLDRLEGGVDRAVALRLGASLPARFKEGDLCKRLLPHAARLVHGDELPVLLRRVPGLLRDQGLQVLVEDLGFLVGEVLEA